MRTIIEVFGWILVASLLVLIVMNATNVVKVLGSASSAVVSESALLTGSGYGTAGYGSMRAAA